jgi:hypothetical protein
VLLLLLGTLNAIGGRAAIGNTHVSVHTTDYIFASLNTWGWVVLCIGVLELLVGLGVFVKNQFARRTDVVVLAANAIAQLLMMPAYPFWLLTIFAIDIVAIHGLIAYGKRIGEVDRQTLSLAGLMEGATVLGREHGTCPRVASGIARSRQRRGVGAW